MTQHPLDQPPGVWILQPDPARPRPRVGIVGGVHGNEPCGLAVVHGLLDPEHPLRRALKRGTLVLIHGNPEAGSQRRRYSLGGTDLNRIFDFQFLDGLQVDQWTVEHHRARSLRPVLEGLDALLDLHSTTLPTSPFVLTTPPHLELASRLGCRYVTCGWEQPDLLADRVLSSVLQRRGLPALAVECGQHDDPASVAEAWAVTERFLEALELLHRSDRGHRDAPVVLDVWHRVGRPGLHFRFNRPLKGFDRLVRGEVIGEGDGVRLSLTRDAYVIMPNDGVAVGDDLLYLASPRPE